MGGRGSTSMSRGGSSAAADYSRGAALSADLGIPIEHAAEMQDAIDAWASGSGRIKAAMAGSASATEQDIANAALIDEFISKSPNYQGELIRVMNVSDYRKPRKGGKIESDGTVTSWTVPGNYSNVMNGFGSGSGTTVVMHVSATHGADIRKYSMLAALDQEIIQARGYDASLTVSKVQTKTERTMAYPEGIKVTHVYLSE